MPNSLILTPFDHFHFRLTLGLLSSHYLTVCHKTVKMKLLLFGRVSPSVAQRQKAVLQTKLGKTKVVWFPVLVSTLILQMTP